jgi:hypothetical protein
VFVVIMHLIIQKVVLNFFSGFSNNSLKRIKVGFLIQSPHLRGELLRPPENSVPQTIVFRNKETGIKLCRKHRKKVMFLSKYSLDRNNIIASLFRTQ